jgi:succinate dehydrogenase / fumarate reductase, membrane anchor subunit
MVVMVARLLSGPRMWLLQRLTAVVVACYGLLLTTLLIIQKPARFEAWQAVFTPGWMRIATLLFLFSLFVHAWLGVHDIFQDYLPIKLRYKAEWLLAGVFLLYSIWSVNILWP